MYSFKIEIEWELEWKVQFQIAGETIKLNLIWTNCVDCIKDCRGGGALSESLVVLESYRKRLNSLHLNKFKIKINEFKKEFYWSALGAWIPQMGYT